MLRRAEVPLVVWRSFSSERYDEPAAKVVAAEEVRAAAAHADDVVASEWPSDEGRRLLMLEWFC